MEKIDEKPIQHTPVLPKGKAPIPKKATPESNKQPPLGEPKVMSTTARVKHTDGQIRDITVFNGDPPSPKGSSPQSDTVSYPGISQDTYGDLTILGRDQYQHVKKQFVRSIDAHEEHELVWLRFEYDFVAGKSMMELKARDPTAQE